MSSKLKVLLIGSKGRMGQEITRISKDNNAEIIGSCDISDNPSDYINDCNVLIDFSFYNSTYNIAKLAVEYKKPLVIGTTGHDENTKLKIVELIDEKIPVVWSGNYSIGVNTLNFLTKITANILKENFVAEIIEMHHHNKKDAPSGTAERLIDILKSEYKLENQNIIHGRSGIIGERPKTEIGVHSIRGGDIVGEHSVLFCGDGERLELKHKATDRKIFAQGALFAAHWLQSAKNGLYNMEDVLGLRTKES